MGSYIHTSDYAVFYRYPYAVVGIDLTGVIYSWLKEGELDSYLFSTCSQPPSITNFMEIFCEVPQIQ